MVDLTSGTILAQIINFLILLFILAKFAYKPICNMLEERKERIANDLAAAESAKVEAQEMRQSYEDQLQAARKEAQEIVEKAVQEAKAVLSDLRQQLDTERDKARREIEEERDQAMKSLREDIVFMSVAMASKVVEKDMNSETNAKLIDDAIAHLNSKTMGL